MKNLLKLINEQNELNVYIDEKVEALRKHQLFLNETIPEQFIKNGLEYITDEKKPNMHLFTYSELEITIEVKNPIDQELPLSKAISKRLEIEIKIKRKVDTESRLYSIMDRTKYKTEYKENGTYRYSIYREEDAEKDLFEIIDRIFNHEIKQEILDPNKDLPF